VGRIRTVKPDVAKHELLFDAEKETGLPIRFAWVMLFTQCDRAGRFRWRPRQLKSDILPHDDVDFSRVLDALWTRGFIRRYRVEGNDYGYIPTWDKHQIINNRESNSEIPEPSESFLLQAVDASSTRAARVVKDDAKSLRHTQGEGEGEYGKGIKPKPSARKARGPVNNSQMAKATGQTRHARVQQIVMGFYRDWAGTECPWGPGEGANLKRLLDSTPNWPDGQLITCLHNLAKSQCIPKGDRPREWLEKLPKFLHGPLDTYWKAKGGANGNGTYSKAEQQERNRQERYSRRLEKIDAGDGVAGEGLPDGVQRSRAAAVGGSAGASGEILPPGDTRGP